MPNYQNENRATNLKGQKNMKKYPYLFTMISAAVQESLREFRFNFTKPW